MSDVMLSGVLKMSNEMAMSNELSRLQFYQRVLQLDARVEAQPAQPEQEPVAWMCSAFDGKACEQSNHDECENPIPLYTTPPRREWVGLTDAEAQLIYDMGRTPSGMMEMVESKLKEKNNG